MEINDYTDVRVVAALRKQHAAACRDNPYTQVFSQWAKGQYNLAKLGASQSRLMKDTETSVARLKNQEVIDRRPHNAKVQSDHWEDVKYV
jgi:hypothetical protein